MADKVKKKKDPISSFSILLILLVVLAVASWIAAAATGGVVTGASLSNILTAPIYGFAGAPEGIVESSVNPETFPGGALEVCFFVMILGGFLGVMTKTGALDNGIECSSRSFMATSLLFSILMILFSIGGTTYGMCEETVPFYVLLAATMYAAGFDVMVGSALVGLLGAGCGVIGSTVYPFAVGAAVSSLIDAGIEVNQGIIIALGAILWIVTTAISIVYVMKYAAKVKKDCGSTILSLQEQADEEGPLRQGRRCSGRNHADRSSEGRTCRFRNRLHHHGYQLHSLGGFSASTSSPDGLPSLRVFRWDSGTSLRPRAGSSCWPSSSLLLADCLNPKPSRRSSTVAPT